MEPRDGISYGKLLVRVLVMLVAASLVGTTLLWGVFELPSERIQDAGRRSLPVFYEEGIYPQIGPFEPTYLDNFTDAVMFEIACYHDLDRGALAAAMATERPLAAGDNHIERLSSYLADPDVRYDVFEYSRYWHGYLVLLKPLLCLGISLAGIRIINGCVFALLLAIIGALLFKRRPRSLWLIVPLIALFLSIDAFVIPLSIQYSSSCGITLLAVVALLGFPKLAARREALLTLFFMIGVVTSYMDLLTYPLVTFGVPAALALFCRRGSRRETLRDGCFLMAGMFVFWAGGYAFMWLAKWLIASAILQHNVVLDAVSQVAVRTSPSGEVNVYAANLAVFFHSPVTNVFLLIALLCYLVSVGRFRKGELAVLVPFLLIAATPIAWYTLVSNHSVVHCWMTYRVLSVTFFSLYTGLACLLADRRLDGEGLGAPRERMVCTMRSSRDAEG